MGRATPGAALGIGRGSPGGRLLVGRLVEAAVQALAAARGLGLADYVHIGRLAVSGTNVGPSFFSLLRVLGRDRVLVRVGGFLSAL